MPGQWRRPPEYVILVAQLPGMAKTNGLTLLEALAVRATPAAEQDEDPHGGS